MHLLLAACLGGLTLLLGGYWLLCMPHGTALKQAHRISGTALQGPLDIWIVAGQSNAVGFNSLVSAGELGPLQPQQLGYRTENRTGLSDTLRGLRCIACVATDAVPER